MIVNYGINRTVERGRIEHRNGAINLLEFDDVVFQMDGPIGDAFHTEVKRRIKQRHPNWLITGYAPRPRRLLLNLPLFVDVPNGALFYHHSQPGRLFLKLTRIFYGADFDILRAATGILGARDCYHASPSMRVDMIGTVRDQELVCQIYDREISEWRDELDSSRAYRHNPAVQRQCVLCEPGVCTGECFTETR